MRVLAVAARGGHVDLREGRPRFAIEARAQGTPTKDQMRLMMQSLLADRFQRGRILDQRRHEGKSRDLYYLVYREPDGRVFALIAAEVGGRFRIVIPELPMSRSHRYLWDYTWTN